MIVHTIRYFCNGWLRKNVAKPLSKRPSFRYINGEYGIRTHGSLSVTASDMQNQYNKPFCQLAKLSPVGTFRRFQRGFYYLLFNC